MTPTEALETLYNRVEKELQRSEYPKDFPTLPPVPSARYCSQEFYDLEIQHVFHKSWLYAGHVSELPERGSYKLFEQMGLSIIVNRGTDDEIRAFRNVCRHRGAALVTEKKGTARRLICPYHSWGYATDGSLQSVPEAHNFSCLNKAENSLFQVRCEIWNGFVYINLDDTAQPLADFLEPTTAQIEDFPLGEMIVKDEIVVEIDCNWKTAYDNFLEIYHVNTVHAKTLSPFLDSKSFTISLFANGHARFVTRKRDGQSFFSDGNDDQAPTDFTTRFKDLLYALPIFPNVFTALDPVGFSFQTFWPAGPNKMIMVATMMGWRRDDDADKAFWAQMVENQKVVLAEDIALFDTIQRTYVQGELPTIRLGFQEQYIYWYHEELDRRIGPDNIPDSMRVKQVLAPHALT